jgi:hypothetical protein
VNITYQGGTHGSYLRFCIDKFSRLTPTLEGTPFTDNNTSHNPLQYSEKISLYHPGDHFENTDRPHILITVDVEDLLFLERWVTIRAADNNISTNQNMITLNTQFLDAFKWKAVFQKYYNIDISKNSIPKFLMRDFYKLSFLDPNKNGFIQSDKSLRKNKPKNTFEFPVSCFWDTDKFFSTLRDADKALSLDLDLSDMSIHKTFLDKLHFLKSRHRVYDIIENIEQKKDMNISDIDTVEQAYISAWLEKTHDFVSVPLVNYFFQSTSEIIKWIEYYPQHYKAMNPNLPTFNGIPNPFHLWNLKK